MMAARALRFIGIVLVTGSALAVSRGSAGAATKHAAYMYGGTYRGPAIRRPGSRLVVYWVARRWSALPASKPTTFSLGVTLDGPYSSVRVLKRLEQRGTQRVAARIARRASSWSNHGFVTALQIPRHAPTGYYDLVISVSTSSFREQGATVIQVNPRGRP